MEQLPIEALGLGTAVREFTVGRAKVVFLTVICLGMASLAVLFLVSLLFLLQVPPAQRTEAIVFDFAFGLPIVALLGRLMSQLANTYGLRALLYPTGVVLRRRGENTVIRWEQIESVQVITRRDGGPLTHLVLLHGAFLFLLLRRLQPICRYTVRLKDGTVTKKPTILADADELGAIIERETAGVCLPQARATYDIGSTIAVGVLTVSRDGSRKGNKTLPWSQFDRTRVRDGKLQVFRIGRRRRWAAVPTGKVPNLYLLQLLIDDIRTEANGSMTSSRFSYVTSPVDDYLR